MQLNRYKTNVLPHEYTLSQNVDKWMSRMARLGDGKALSPNAGMEGWEEFEECTMNSDRDFRRALYICG